MIEAKAPVRSVLTYDSLFASYLIDAVALLVLVVEIRWEIPYHRRTVLVADLHLFPAMTLCPAAPVEALHLEQHLRAQDCTSCLCTLSTGRLLSSSSYQVLLMYRSIPSLPMYESNDFKADLQLTLSNLPSLEHIATSFYFSQQCPPYSRKALL